MPQLRLFNDALTDEDVWNVFTAEDTKLSRGEIAARLGISKSRRLIAVLNHMVETKQLWETKELLINRTEAFFYERT